LLLGVDDDDDDDDDGATDAGVLPSSLSTVVFVER